MKQFGHTCKEVSEKSKIEEVAIDEVVYVHITAVLQRKMPDLYYEPENRCKFFFNASVSVTVSRDLTIIGVCAELVRGRKDAPPQ